MTDYFSLDQLREFEQLFDSKNHCSPTVAIVGRALLREYQLVRVHEKRLEELLEQAAARLDDAEALIAERDTLREALERVRWWLDAENESSIETGWEKATAVIDSALARLSSADERGL